jgi:hypothetical protein
MNDPGGPEEDGDRTQNDPDRPRGYAEEESHGPNLVLLYSLIALALVTAIGLAGLIILPFYRRR